MITTTEWYEKLSGVISDEILLLKDEKGQCYLERADEKRHIDYFVRNILASPWRNQIAIGMVVGLARNLDVASIVNCLKALNSLFKNTFETLD